MRAMGADRPMRLGWLRPDGADEALGRIERGRPARMNEFLEKPQRGHSPQHQSGKVLPRQNRTRYFELKDQKLRLIKVSDGHPTH